MYCNVCNNYRKFRETKPSNIFKKALSLSIVYSEWDRKYKTMFKEEDSIEILKIVSLINNIKVINIYLDWKSSWNKKLFNWRNKSKWINE